MSEEVYCPFNGFNPPCDCCRWQLTYDNERKETVCAVAAIASGGFLPKPILPKEWKPNRGAEVVEE